MVFTRVFFFFSLDSKQRIIPFVYLSLSPLRVPNLIPLLFFFACLAIPYLPTAVAGSPPVPECLPWNRSERKSVRNYPLFVCIVALLDLQFLVIVIGTLFVCTWEWYISCLLPVFGSISIFLLSVSEWASYLFSLFFLSELFHGM